MHCITPRNRQERCIREDKLVAIHTVGLIYIPILAKQSQFLGFCSTHFGRNRRQILCADPHLFWFFLRSLVFRDKNHKIISK